MSDWRTDVLVVGGGPAGAVAAHQLASAGVEVALIDRATFPRDKTCGESLSPGALARLRTIGMWPRVGEAAASPRSESGIGIRGMRIRSPGGRVFHGRYKGDGDGPGRAVRRLVLDHDLLTSARERGTRVLEGIEAFHAEQTRDGTAVVHGRVLGGSTAVRIEAKRVVVADGRQSFLARELGFIERAAPSRAGRRYAVRAHCEGVAELTSLAEMQVGLGGYCGVAPLSPTDANICYVLFSDRLEMSRRTLDADFRRDLQAFPDVARRLASARIAGPIRIVGPLKIRSRRQAAGAFIACGDTTGFLDPFTGEGIAHAIASGVLGADAVRASLSGRRDAFHEYEREVRALRRVKGTAARLLYGLVSRPALADSAAAVFARMPRLSDAIVQLFGDQV